MHDLEHLAQKRIHDIENYAQRIYKVIDMHISLVHKYERILCFISKHIDRIMKTIIKFLSKGLIYCINKQMKLMTIYKKGLIKIDWFIRKSTVPINFFYFLYLKTRQFVSSDPLLAQGVHYITALMGGGKSSLMFDCAEEIREKTGKGTYINVSMEKSRYDEFQSLWYKFHPEFDIEEFWGVKKYMNEETQTEEYRIEQLRQFDLEFDNLILDEWLSKMNHRQNNTKVYKEIFIAFIAAIAHMRHQHMKRIWIASQLDTTDIQLMAMFKYIHEIEVDLNISYWDWVRTGKLDKHIKGWHIWTYKYKRNRKKSATEKILYKKYYRPKTANFDYFESMNQSYIYKNLPKHEINYQKGKI